MLQVMRLVDRSQVSQISNLGRKVDNIELPRLDITVRDRYICQAALRLVPDEPKRRDPAKFRLHPRKCRYGNNCESARTINVRRKATLHVLADDERVFLIGDI